MSTAAPAQPEPAEPTGAMDGPVTAATRAQLAEAGRETSPLGQVALVLAWRLDQRADTASALAAAAKQLESTLAAAVRGAQVASSPLDELRARRDAQRGA